MLVSKTNKHSNNIITANMSLRSNNNIYYQENNYKVAAAAAQLSLFISLLLWFDNWDRLLASLDARPYYGRGRHGGVVTGADRLGDLSRVAASVQVFLSDSLLYPVDLVLVTLSISHCSLLGFLQGCLQSLQQK